MALPKDTFTSGIFESDRRGLENVFEYNGLILNDQVSSADRYIIDEVAGIDDADLRDVIEDNPGRHGQTAYDALYGGRTIVLTGRIKAGDIQRIRNMQTDMRKAFNDLTLHPLKLRFWDWTDDASKDLQYLYTFHTAGGTITVTNGEWQTANSGVKNIMWPYRQYYEAEAVMSFIANASTSPNAAGVKLRMLDANNYLLVRQDTSSNRLELMKFVGGTPSSLNQTSTAGLTTGNRYWVLGRVIGDEITYELWNADPHISTTSSRITSQTVTISDSTFLKANAGLTYVGWILGGQAIGAKYGDFRIRGIDPSDVQINARKGAPILSREVQVDEKYERQFQITLKCPDPRFLSTFESVISESPTIINYQNILLEHPNLISHWRLDETSGTTATDSKSGHNGTYSGVTLNQTPLITQSGTKSASFSTGRILVPDHSDLDITGKLSIEFWLKTNFTSSSSIQYLFVKGPSSAASTNYRVTLVYSSVGVDMVYLRGNGSIWAITSGTIPNLNDNNKKHIVIVDDSFTVKFYINSALILSGSSIGSTSATNTNSISIGSIETGGNYFVGTLDEIALYNNALTSTEIAYHYNLGQL